MWTRHQDALITALQEPVRKQEALPFLGNTIANLAAGGIGELVRGLIERQREALRLQLALLLEQGPTTALLDTIASTVGLTPRHIRAVSRFYATQVAAGTAPRVAAQAARTYADRLRQLRAALIARTEAVRYTNAVVFARAEAMGGVVLKQWLSARDTNVDLICFVLDNNQRQALHEPFTVQGQFWQHPPAHPGCRCVLEIWRVL